MANWRSCTLQPIHGLERATSTAWRAVNADPQFRVDGPFRRGLWELRFSGAAPGASAHDRVAIYYARDGAFTEHARLRFPPLGPDEQQHSLSFWLPVDAQWLRFDPKEAPGPFVLHGMWARRRSATAAILRGMIRGLRQSPRRAFQRLRMLARSAGRRAERNRILLEIALQPPKDGYEAWLETRVRMRAGLYPVRPQAGLFSILTTVFDTDPSFLDALVESVLAQTWRDFEWVIVDNGSRHVRTRERLGRLKGESRVRLFRVERNLGIVGGMRFVLERATGKYVLPVDSDDYIFPDALATIASVIQRLASPPMLYSDEDKLLGGRHTDAFFKPDWDPVLLRNCCYVAHLCAVDRREALDLGAYTDRGAEGCHDWDTFLRFVRAGRSAAHVPEILYSWRMHHASTAANVQAKSYIVESQRHVLNRHLESLGLSDLLVVEASPFFPASPDWWIRHRRASLGDRIPVVLWVANAGDSVGPVLQQLCGSPAGDVWLAGPGASTAASNVARPELAAAVHVASGLAEALTQAARSAAVLAVVDSRVVPTSDEWVWEIAALHHAFPDAVMLGGRILDQRRRVASGAAVLGFGAGLDSPDRGRAAADVGYFGTAAKQCSASAVSGLLCGLDAKFSSNSRRGPGDFGDPCSLSRVIALRALSQGKRIVFSPFIEAAGEADLLQCLAAQFDGPAPVDSRFYHSLLSRDPMSVFRRSR
jgi:hypothetical protein